MDEPAIAADPRHVAYTHLMYGLHALAVLVGVLTVASIAVRFVFGVPSLIAIVMNYARRDAVQGSWLATHFAWQRQTFWRAFVAVAIVWLAFGPLALFLISWPMRLGYFLIGIWVSLRVARGWLALRDGRTMPVRP